jgi:predicted negative regulator of RcsB-dependent stress response
MLHDIKGSIYVLKGKRKLAEKEYMRSLELHPNNTDARRALDALKR